MKQPQPMQPNPPPPGAKQPPPPGGKQFPPPGKTAAQQAHEDQLKEEKRSRTKNCCKKVLKFMFSHIGLCGMVIAYSVAGGFIFEHLEKTNEQQECIKSEEKYLPAENDTKYKLWTISTTYQTDEYQEHALAEFQRILRKFRTTVLELSYDGKNCTDMGSDGGPGYKWSFAGALLFSVTVITTIGYGNIAPKTFWGRLVCIAYATLGIPLMLLCLANIGDVMADVFRFVYAKVCCCGCCRRKDKNKVESLQSPGNQSGRKTPEAWKSAYESNKTGMPPPKQGPMVVDDDEEEEDEEDDKISVPLTITMAVIAGYIFMGALLFGVWEGWKPLQASYFCFVTISTIGFGDVVPGAANFEKSEDQYKMILSAIYMLFGMAILSMCFSLIQEEIVAKFKWVGEKIGILEKDKPEQDEDEEEPTNPDQKKPNPNNRNPNNPIPNQRGAPPPHRPMMPPPAKQPPPPQPMQPYPMKK